MTKEEAVRLILDLAAQNGGKLSFRKFIDETGIPEQRLRREPWFTRWNNLLQEIGLTTEQFSNEQTPDDEIAAAVAELILLLKRWPTEDEFARNKKANPKFPDVRVIRRAKKSGKLRSLLEHYNSDDDSQDIVRGVATDLPTIKNEEDLGPDVSLRVQGYVYLMKNERSYKIGFTNSPSRRHREVRIELPNETLLIHTIETDDPKGIEKYWHNRFAKKQIGNSEWFKLDAVDIKAFKRRKYQ